MSEENVEQQYRAADAFSRRDLDAFVAICDPDMELVSRHLELDGSGHLRGHAAVRRWWETLLSVYPNFTSEIEEVRDLGDVTVARQRFRGQGIQSDAPIEQMQWFVTQWRNGKAIWWRTFQSEAEALEAAGRREQAMSQENVETFRRLLEAWNRRDADLGRRYLAPEIEWEPASPAVIEGDVYRGYDEVASAAAALWETWEVFRFEESEIRDLGDSLVWLGQVHIKGSASQVELDQEFGIHSLVRGGKIVRAKAFLSWREALEAAGLREEGGATFRGRSPAHSPTDRRAPTRDVARAMLQVDAACPA
jgi:ketosteroid isomerase-like protein